MTEQELWEVSQRAYRAYTDALEMLGRTAIVAIDMDYFEYLKDEAEKVRRLESIWRDAADAHKASLKTPEGV